MKDHGETDRRGRGLGLDEDVSSCSGHFITFWLQFAQRFWLDFIFHLFVEHLLDACSGRQTLHVGFIRTKTEHFNKELNHR